VQPLAPEQRSISLADVDAVTSDALAASRSRRALASRFQAAWLGCSQPSELLVGCKEDPVRPVEAFPNHPLTNYRDFRIGERVQQGALLAVNQRYGKV